MRSYNLPEWKALAHETHHQPPARRGERRRNQEKVVRAAPGLRGRAATAAAKAATEAGADETPEEPKVKRKPGRPRRNPLPVKVEDESEDESVAKRGGRSNATPTPAESKKKGRAGGRGTNKTVTSRRLNNTTESVDHIDAKAFKNFDYRMEGTHPNDVRNWRTNTGRVLLSTSPCTRPTCLAPCSTTTKRLGT
jgi:hypothetical protein